MISHKIILAAIVLTISAQTVKSEQFSNPVLVDADRACQTINIDENRFSADFELVRQINICQSISDIGTRLRNIEWSAELNTELTDIWKIFTEQEVFFAEMPPNSNPEILAVAHSFPPGKARNKFSCAIYLKRNVESKKFLYHVLFHELRHVYDFHNEWVFDVEVPLFELERRAFRLMSLIDEETPKTDRYSKIPSLWQDDWQKLDKKERENKRNNEIAKFLKKSIHYKNLYLTETVSASVSIAEENRDLEIEVQSPPKLIRRRGP